MMRGAFHDPGRSTVEFERRLHGRSHESIGRSLRRACDAASVAVSRIVFVSVTQDGVARFLVSSPSTGLLAAAFEAAGFEVKVNGREGRAIVAVLSSPTRIDSEAHHVIWWRNGGLTDLANLLPLCERHHHRVHDDGWQLSLDPDRTLTITYPDGSVQTTGPPSRLAG
jgi:hypothetical protein